MTPYPSISQETPERSLFFKLYSDGYTLIEYSLSINSTLPVQNITVFGQVLEDLLIIDSKGLPVDYSIENSTITIYSLGEEEIEISYLTQDLTSKDGRFWTFAFLAPISVVIELPDNAAIISLNKVPEIIEINENRVIVVMNFGFVELTYVVGVVGTKEHAQIILDEAENTINEILNIGIIITEAEEKLQKAKEAFNLGNYVQTESLGVESKDLAILINQTATQAKDKILEAEASFTKAQNEERTFGLSISKDLIDQAWAEYTEGNYLQSLNSATQAIIEAENANLQTSEEYEILFYLGIGIFISIILILIGYFIIRFRKKITDKDYKKKKRLINTERIFKENKTLMPDEKTAIQFLVDNNGEAFEAELYDFIKLPRTTTWRMVKRLKNMEIINITKFRRQNLVRIRKKYDFKE